MVGASRWGGRRRSWPQVRTRSGLRCWPRLFGARGRGGGVCPQDGWGRVLFLPEGVAHRHPSPEPPGRTGWSRGAARTSVPPGTGSPGPWLLGPRPSPLGSLRPKPRRGEGSLRVAPCTLTPVCFSPFCRLVAFNRTGFVRVHFVRAAQTMRKVLFQSRESPGSPGRCIAAPACVQPLNNLYFYVTVALPQPPLPRHAFRTPCGRSLT